jgi:hypothetical protein
MAALLLYREQMLGLRSRERLKVVSAALSTTEAVREFARGTGRPEMRVVPVVRTLRRAGLFATSGKGRGVAPPVGIDDVLALAVGVCVPVATEAADFVRAIMSSGPIAIEMISPGRAPEFILPTGSGWHVPGAAEPMPLDIAKTAHGVTGGSAWNALHRLVADAAPGKDPTSTFLAHLMAVHIAQNLRRVQIRYRFPSTEACVYYGPGGWAWPTAEHLTSEDVARGLMARAPGAVAEAPILDVSILFAPVFRLLGRLVYGRRESAPLSCESGAELESCPNGDAVSTSEPIGAKGGKQAVPVDGRGSAHDGMASIAEFLDAFKGGPEGHDAAGGRQSTG